MTIPAETRDIIPLRRALEGSIFSQFEIFLFRITSMTARTAQSEFPVGIIFKSLNRSHKIISHFCVAVDTGVCVSESRAKTDQKEGKEDVQRNTFFHCYHL
jgi:hypothetical protein